MSLANAVAAGRIGAGALRCGCGAGLSFWWHAGGDGDGADAISCDPHGCFSTPWPAWRARRRELCQLVGIQYLPCAGPGGVGGAPAGNGSSTLHARSISRLWPTG